MCIATNIDACEKVTFHVSKPTLKDATALNCLYENDYVQCHRGLFDGSAASASMPEWKDALGDVDFRDVIRDTLADKGTGSVRLLKCTVSSGSKLLDVERPVGYVLYELRSKGPKKNRQRFCELVNIVVDDRYRGNGAGSVLLEALLDDLDKTAKAESGDVRLFVAEQNIAPANWYKRMGFAPSGFQNEKVGGDDVKFVRMIRKVQDSGDSRSRSK